MAPAISPRSASGEHLRTISRSVSSTFNTLSTRETPVSKTPIASLFAVIVQEIIRVSKRTLRSAVQHASRSPVAEPSQPVFLYPSTLSKRQNAILAIPTTYSGLHDGPAPGAVVGIVLGAIGGFILILYILLSAFRLSGAWGRDTIVEEEIVRHSHRRSPRRSRSHSHSRVMSEVSGPRHERVQEREETVVVEEHLEPSVVVEEEEDDVVEVFEDHSPERPPRKPRGTFRTVDPAEFGGGSRPGRHISRR